MRQNTLTVNGPAQGILGQGDAVLDAWGRQKVVEDYSLFHGMFTFDVPDTMWLLRENTVERTTIVGSTRATSVKGKLVLKSGVVQGDVSELESRRHPRYQPNRGTIYSSSIFLPNPTQGQADFGLFVDDHDGIFFRRKEDGNLYAVKVSDGVQTHEELITVPYDTFDISKGNTYDIQMQWRGVGFINFYIGNPRTSYSEIVHTIALLGKTDELIISNPALSLAFRTTNTSGTEASLYCGCADMSSEGGNKATEQYAASIGNEVSCSTDTPILVVRAPLLINGKTNTRDSKVYRISANADKKVDVSFWVTRDPTAITGGTYAAIGGGSYTEQNKTATSVTIAKMRLVTTFNVLAGGVGSVDNPNKDTIEFIMVHGDYLVLTGTGASATTQGVITWGEEV